MLVASSVIMSHEEQFATIGIYTYITYVRINSNELFESDIAINAREPVIEASCV